MDDVTAHLLTLVTMMRENHIFIKIMQQSVSQAFYYISAFTLNELLRDKSLCRPKYGFQIKLSISVLDMWLASVDDKGDDTWSLPRYVFICFDNRIN